jgi:hypothetical protein
LWTEQQSLENLSVHAQWKETNVQYIKFFSVTIHMSPMPKWLWDYCSKQPIIRNSAKPIGKCSVYFWLSLLWCCT